MCEWLKEGILYFFDNTIGVKQGCPLSLTLCGLYIDELKQMVGKFVKEDITTRNEVFMLLLNVDALVFFANTLEED